MGQQRCPNADATGDGVFANGIDGVEQILHRKEAHVRPLWAARSREKTIGRHVALALMLGLLTSSSALVGLFMSINIFLATHWMSFYQQVFHIALAACMQGFVIGRGCRGWGLDPLIVKRCNNRWLQRFL